MAPSRVMTLAFGLTLAAACGGDDDAASSDGPTSSTTSSTAGPPVEPEPCPPETVGGATALSAEVGVVDDAAVRAGQPVTWRLLVTSGSQDETVLVFPSGQDADVALATAGGAEVYRWSTDRFFTEALRCRPLAAGQSLTVDVVEESLDIAPGTYRLTATLVAEPAPAPLEQTVVVE